MANIVVVDDEIEILDLISLYLKSDGHNTICFSDSIKANNYLENNVPDGLILDIMMPNLDGLSLLSNIRKKYDYPIILLTAKTGQNDVLKGLYSGADDYIKKPFEPLELIVRLNIHLKKQNRTPKGQLSYRNLYLEKDSHKCEFNGEDLKLTPTEFQIIEVLAGNIGKVMGYEEIFMQVWQDDYLDNDSNTVSVHIRNIRYKMYQISKEADLIKTVWGVGYKIE